MGEEDLKAHKKDKRHYVYTVEELESAKPMTVIGCCQKRW